MNSLTKTLLALAAFGTLAGWNGGVRASILGDTLTLDYADITSGSSSSGALGFPSSFQITQPGSLTFFILDGHFVNVAYGATATSESIFFDIGSNSGAFKSALFLGPVLTVDAGSKFGPLSSVKGLPFGDVTGSALSVNWQGVSFKAGDSVIVTFGNAVSVSAVPLPATLPLFGMALLGLAGIGYGLKRNGRRNVAAA